jgi:hypothetical protein
MLSTEVVDRQVPTANKAKHPSPYEWPGGRSTAPAVPNGSPNKRKKEEETKETQVQIVKYGREYRRKQMSK